MSKGYTDTSAVALALSREFTGDEETMADLLIGEAEDYIDRQTGLKWLDGGTASETRQVIGGMVTLGHRPITAITSVTAQRGLWSEPQVLVSSDYTILDVATGTIAIRVRDGSLATIAYTYDDDVPALISQAARDYVVARMGGGLSEGFTPDIRRYRIADGTEVERFDTAQMSDGIPASVHTAIRSFRREWVV